MNMLTSYGIHLQTYMFIDRIGSKSILMHRFRPVILWDYGVSRLVFISDLNLPLKPEVGLGFIIHIPNGPVRKVYGRVVWKESSTAAKAHQYGVLIDSADAEPVHMTKQINRKFGSGRATFPIFEYNGGLDHNMGRGEYFDVIT